LRNSNALHVGEDRQSDCQSDNAVPGSTRLHPQTSYRGKKSARTGYQQEPIPRITAFSRFITNAERAPSQK
jgi:hypothetical protein